MPFKSPHPLYTTWQGIKRRCDSPNHRQWMDYGGRGISVCERWLHSFHNFLEDMGPRPEGFSIERIDNDGPYSPENCKWASKKEQQRNRRINVYVEIGGEKYLAVALAESSGLKTDTVVKRAKMGLTFDEVTFPDRLDRFPRAMSMPFTAAQKRKRKTHCKRGHEFSADNIYAGANGSRVCRTCHREKVRRQTLAKKSRNSEG